MHPPPLLPHTSHRHSRTRFLTHAVFTHSLNILGTTAGAQSGGNRFDLKDLKDILNAIPEKDRVTFLQEREQEQTKREQEQEQTKREQEQEQTKREELKLKQEEERTKQARLPNTLTQENSSKSASQLGYEELLTLNTQGDSRTTNFKGGSGAAVLSAEEESIGKAKESEKLLNVYMTPFLSEVFEIDGRILVNGEEFGWIEVMPGHSQFNCKPDFAVGPAGYFDIKSAPNADERVAKARAEVTMPLRFGTPLWQLRDSVIVLESKKKISSEGFGELLNYLRHIHCPKFPITRGMLFDPTDFWLVECVYGVVTKRVISKWTAAGSVQLIRNFFPLSEWERVQLGVCEELKVTVIDDGFLGAGGSGRVFRVESDDRRGKALKLVLNGNIHGMRVEHALISDSERKKLPHLVSSSTDDIAVMDGMGAGYAMTPVGQQVTATSDNVDAIFASLNTLHEAKLVHGDARLANVVFCLGQHVWVDLMLSRNDPFEVQIWQDLGSLAKSCLKCKDLPQSLRAMSEARNRTQFVGEIKRLLSTSTLPSS